MAKGRKPKVEEPKIEVPETVIEQPEIKKDPIAELIEKADGEPIDMAEVDEVMKDAGYRKIEVEDEKVFDKEPLVSKELEISQNRIFLGAQEDLSMEQRVVNFLESKPNGEIKMNDFLKSLFPISKFNEPAVWLRQESSKQIRNLLENMQSNGLLTIVNDNHRRLGTAYYPDHTTGKTHYYDLNNVIITAKK